MLEHCRVILSLQTLNALCFFTYYFTKTSLNQRFMPARRQPVENMKLNPWKKMFAFPLDLLSILCCA